MTLLVDINHTLGGDLVLSPSGDLATSTGPTRSTQRLLRRLLTNLGGYIWELSYGAGLPGFVGKPIDAKDVEAVISAQVVLEPSVAQTPAPKITVTTDNGNSAVYVSIVFVDQDTGQTETLNFPLG